MSERGTMLRGIIAGAAWTLVGILVLGLARLAISPFRAFLDDPSGSSGALFAKALTLVVISVCLIGWVATLLHVAMYAPLRSPVQRVIIFTVLLFLSGLSPFLYYFTYLYWAPKPSSVEAAV
jgi:hypothetical protein